MTGRTNPLRLGATLNRSHKRTINDGTGLGLCAGARYHAGQIVQTNASTEKAAHEVARQVLLLSDSFDKCYFRVLELLAT